MGAVVGPGGFEPPTYGSGASASRILWRPMRGPPLCLAELRARPQLSIVCSRLRLKIAKPGMPGWIGGGCGPWPAGLVITAAPSVGRL
ncbi:hypothetical protein apy_09700 [Aeropyrum pernix]|uniref:Uncharacterized protein n=1 Tax=Aeropyrum pernix TaxID=56636 RepID=A0A401H9W5_AERPX|nr:hypothetical protein apy_09700 [Aeropyrum pernix]